MESGEFVINTAQELAEFALLVSGTLTAENNPNGRHIHEDVGGFAGKTVKLGSDIDLSSYKNASGEQISWTPAGTADSPFLGTFDGGGHVVSGLLVNENIPLAGLFGVVGNGAAVKNTGVDGRILAGTLAGSIAARTESGSVIDNCFSSAEISGTSSAGGIAGENNGSITACFNFGQLSASGFAGGIAAVNGGTINQSFNTGIIIADGAAVGGIASDNASGSIAACFEASFLQGGSVAAIANGGTVSGDCYYDSFLLLAEDPGVSSDIPVTNNSYQLPAVFTAFPSVAEYAALRMNFRGEKFDQFSSATLNKVLSDGTPVALTQSSEMFILDNSGSSWSILTNAEGNCYLIASVKGFTHKYYVTAVPNITVRYEFGLTELLGSRNMNYKEGYSSVSTWTADGVQRVISTADDYKAFVEYVNGGGRTEGVTFILGSSINMTSVQGVKPVGTKENPFAGTFDGRGYTIEGLAIDAAGAAAMFGYIGAEGVVGNFVLNNVSVTARKGSGDIYLSALAGSNAGLIYNAGAVGSITADNLGYSYTSYIGSLAAYNQGKIRGCYFRQADSVSFGINHSSKSSDFTGGMVGKNEGMMTGCYIVTDALSRDIKADVYKRQVNIS